MDVLWDAVRTLDHYVHRHGLRFSSADIVLQKQHKRMFSHARVEGVLGCFGPKSSIEQFARLPQTQGRHGFLTDFKTCFDANGARVLEKDQLPPGHEYNVYHHVLEIGVYKFGVDTRTGCAKSNLSDLPDLCKTHKYPEGILEGSSEGKRVDIARWSTLRGGRHSRT